MSRLITTDEIRKLLDASMLVNGEVKPKMGYEAICACDMISELLSIMNEKQRASREAILLTALTNTQVIRASETVDIHLVVFIRNKKPAPETIELARSLGITLMSTPFSMYKSCGILYGANMRDVNEGMEMH
ncbi:MAG: hypothetical protein AB1546_01100 [bacterium]